MRGYLILSTQRSGSNWIGSLLNEPGTMGNSSEWLARKINRLGDSDFESFYRNVMKLSSSANGNFGMKIFPRHLFEVNERFNRDFIQEALIREDVLVIYLKRNDALRQAISLARAKQTRQFAAHLTSRDVPKYDFALIAKCYFDLRESYAFWENYLEVRKMPHQTFVYEEISETPLPILTPVARHFGEPVPSAATERFKVQRDNLTEEWVQQFERDIVTSNLLAASDRRQPIKRSPGNLMRLVSRKLLPQPPYSF